ncbi:MAG: class IV adenylate cyclase [Granulosicoccus sp.]
MASNIEVKARLNDLSEAKKTAERLTDSAGQKIVQRDTFFYCESGRLKLREFLDGSGELISYHRADTSEAATSDYLIYQTESATSLRETLAKTLHVKGEVRKSRYLYLSGRTRIHLDSVEGLGSYIELEVVLERDDDQKVATQEATGLMRQFGINQSDLVDVAYIDLLINATG